MNKQELAKSFTEFIVNDKKYYKDCLAFDFSVKSKNGGNSYIDLIIFDNNIVNKPLAIVEFKTVIPAEGATIEKTKEYLNYVGRVKVPAYLICPSEDDFLIYELIESKWKKVSKVDFPDLKNLKDIVVANERLKDFEEAKQAKEKTRQLQRKKAYYSLLAIVIALTGGFISILTISDIFPIKKKAHIQNKEIVERIDSIEAGILTDKDYTAMLSRKLSELYALNDSIDSVSQFNQYSQNKLIELTQAVDLMKNDYSDIKKELGQLKDIISKDPLYLIELNRIRTDIIMLEKDLDNDIVILRSQVESTREKYNFLIGGIITLIASILILAIPNILQGIKNTKANN